MGHAAAARVRRRSSIRWDRVGRVGLLSTLVTIMLLYVSPAKHWIEQSRTAGEQERQLDELAKEKRMLERRVRALRDPGSLERKARALGMIRAGERAYVVRNLPHP
jgi:cell division protein FtsB